MRRKRVWGAAAIITAVIAAALLLTALFLTSHRGWYLTVRDAHSGAEYGRWRVEPGEEIGLGFIHSVNLYPLLDVFEVGEDGVLYAETTIYYQFGAGVQTELNQGETFSVGEDGALIVDNIHKPFEELSSSAGGFSDRTLLLGTVSQDYPAVKDRIGVYSQQLETQVNGTTVVSLSQLCGKDSIITLSCEYQLF